MKRNNADVDIVSKFYNVSKKKALEFLDILTESEMKYIKNSLHYGVIEK